MQLKALPFLLAAAIALPLGAWANDEIITLSAENDMFTQTGDQFYTNGARAAWMDSSFIAPEPIRTFVSWLPFFDPNQPTGVQYSIGQNLYTPSDITQTGPQYGDRPYAAFLYGSVGMSQISPDRSVVDDLELTLGWIGPGALGEATQKAVHRWVDAKKPMGWDNQLNDEPALNLALQRRWPSLWALPFGGEGAYRDNNGKRVPGLSFTPHVGAAAGNVYTHASMGGTLRLTSDLSMIVDDPLRVRPSPPGTGYFDTRNDLNGFLFVGAEGRAVARNIFLDGNTFTDSLSVRKKNAVADLQAGFVVTYKRYQLGYTAVYRTPEFQGQDNGQTFGAISLGMKF
jgi:lipid A 3-O-deacylase